jgi:hypothetical protein
MHMLKRNKESTAVVNRLAAQVGTYRDAVADMAEGALTRAPALVNTTTDELRSMGHHVGDQAQRIVEKVAAHKDAGLENLHNIADHAETQAPAHRKKGARKLTGRKLLLLLVGGIAVGVAVNRLIRQKGSDTKDPLSVVNDGVPGGAPTGNAVSTRAEGRPPEEAGSEDPKAQAEAILDDSEIRVAQGAKKSASVRKKTTETPKIES